MDHDNAKKRKIIVTDTSSNESAGVSASPAVGSSNSSTTSTTFHRYSEISRGSTGGLTASNVTPRRSGLVRISTSATSSQETLDRILSEEISLNKSLLQDKQELQILNSRFENILQMFPTTTKKGDQQERDKMLLAELENLRKRYDESAKLAMARVEKERIRANEIANSLDKNKTLLRAAHEKSAEDAKRIENLLQRISEYEKSIEKCNQIISIKESEILSFDSINQKKSQLEDELRAQDRKMADLVKEELLKREALERRIYELEAEVSGLKSGARPVGRNNLDQEIDRKMSILIEKDVELSSREREVEKRCLEFEVREKYLQAQLEEIENLRKQSLIIPDFTLQYEKQQSIWRDEIQSLKDQLALSDAELARLRSQVFVGDSNKQIAELKETIDTLFSDRRNLEDKVRQLSTELTNRTAELNHAITERESVAGGRARNDDQLSALKLKVEDLVFRLNESTANVNRLQEANDKLKRALENAQALLKAKDVEFEKKYAHFSTVLAEYQQQLRKNASLRKQLDRYRILIDGGLKSFGVEWSTKTISESSEASDQKVTIQTRQTQNGQYWPKVEDLVEIEDVDFTHNFIIVKNSDASRTCDMTGWKLNNTVNPNAAPFLFPSGFKLAPQATVKIYSGKNETRKQNPPSSLYWAENAWDELSSKFILTDSQGSLKSGFSAHTQAETVPLSSSGQSNLFRSQV